MRPAILTLAVAVASCGGGAGSDGGDPSDADAPDTGDLFDGGDAADSTTPFDASPLPDASDAGVPVSDAGGNDATPDAATPPNADAGDAAAPDWLDRVRDPDSPVAQRIEAALDGIASDPCAGDPDVVCESDAYAIGSAFLAPDLDPSERVLVVDTVGPSVDMLRYRHRIVGVFELTEQGRIAEVQGVWDLPRTFGDILTGFAAFPPVSAHELTDLHGPLDDAFGEHVPNVSSHGITVHRILTDRVPTRGMVFLDYSKATFHRALPATVCSVGPGSPDADLEPLRAHSRSVASSLVALLAEHRVSVVNASFGFTVASVSGPWMSTCGEPAPDIETLRRILAAYAPLFDTLFGTPGVLAINAAFQGPNPNALDAPYDLPQAEYTNRLRVGSLDHTGTQIPAGGLDAPPPGSTALPGVEAFADVFANTGCDVFGCRNDGTGVTLVGPFGMRTFDLPLNQSSFVAPIVTAEAVHRRHTGHTASAWDDLLIQDLVTELRGNCSSPPCYRDPLLHVRP